jgi:ABC-type phosphate transport system substrate-binding protein
VRPFFQYGFSADGQLDVSSVGYVPLPENIRQEALELIN